MSVRVLVVDDDPAVRKAMALVLSRGGFDVATAADGRPALDTADAMPPDIAVVDYNMPTVNGREVVRALKARYGTAIFVAVLTGDDRAVIRAECLAAGADAVLIKPLSMFELQRRLTAAALALRMPLAVS